MGIKCSVQQMTVVRDPNVKKSPATAVDSTWVLLEFFFFFFFFFFFLASLLFSRNCSYNHSITGYMPNFFTRKCVTT